jgi:hypothetical protein
MARLCRQALVVPASDGRASVMFRCTELDEHTSSENPTVARRHTETGRVRRRSGAVFTYEVHWREEPAETWREERSGPVPTDD